MLETKNAGKLAINIMSLDKAAEFLRSKFPVRTVYSALKNEIERKAIAVGINHDEMEKKFKENIGNDQNDIVQLRNWFDPNNIARIERETAMRMAFALGLGYAEEEADIFLKRLWVDGFYMRDAKDIVYRFGLENGWSYAKAVCIARKFTNLNRSNPNPKGNKDTGTITNDYEAIKDEKELEMYIQENAESFGIYRRKAYERFMEIYEEVKENFILTGDDEHSNSLDTASFKYMCDVIMREFPQLRKKTAYKTVWRHIFNNLPDRTRLGQIVNQRVFRGEVVQVDRKLFILAWLSTKDGGNRLEFKDGQREEAFNTHMEDLNEQLIYCGMPTLDPRHPFDWLIMNTFSYVYNSPDFPNEPDVGVDAFQTRISELVEEMHEESE